MNFGAGAEEAAVRATVSRAEDLGFQLLMTSDHVVLTPDVHAAYPAPFLEPFTLLATVGQLTALPLGTTVAILPYRHPELVASMVDTIERLTGRLFTLGVGLGWAREEFARLNVPFARRVEIYERDLSVLAAHRAAVPDQPDAAHVRSGHFAGDIWVGGNGDRAVERAIAFGQAWHPLGVTPARLRAGASVVAAAGAGTALAPRIKLRPGPRDDDPARVLGTGGWAQIAADLELTVSLGAPDILLDPDVPETRAGTDPWPTLQRAVKIIRGLTG